MRGGDDKQTLPMNHRYTAYFLLLVVSIIWGVAGPVIKFTLGYFPPIIFLTYRFALASAFGATLWAIRPPKLRLNKVPFPISFFIVFLPYRWALAFSFWL